MTVPCPEIIRGQSHRADLNQKVLNPSTQDFSLITTQQRKSVIWDLLFNCSCSAAPAGTVTIRLTLKRIVRWRQRGNIEIAYQTLFKKMHESVKVWIPARIPEAAQDASSALWQTYCAWMRSQEYDWTLRGGNHSTGMVGNSEQPILATTARETQKPELSQLQLRIGRRRIKTKNRKMQKLHRVRMPGEMRLLCRKWLIFVRLCGWWRLLKQMCVYSPSNPNVEIQIERKKIENNK